MYSRLGSIFARNSLKRLESFDFINRLKSVSKSTSSTPPSPSPPTPTTSLRPLLSYNTSSRFPINSFISRFPKTIQPYLLLARMDKPIGTWLTLLPSWWGIAMCAPIGCFPDIWTMSLFAAGGFLMRGAGCTVNDMWDRDFDKQVARTNTRPLAAGDLSMSQAGFFLFSQLSLGLIVLSQLNAPTAQLAGASLFLIGMYPLMKRVTFFPQVVLGFAMNYGILMGAAASATSSTTSNAIVSSTLVQFPEIVTSLPIISLFVTPVDWALVFPPSTLVFIVPLYIGSVCWTVIYDTLYAHQDTVDDAKLGLKSTALWMGEDKTVPILSSLVCVMALCWSCAGIAANLSTPYFLSVFLASLHSLWQVQTANLKDSNNLAKRFKSNTSIGWIILAGIIVSKFI
jgi:4-hydroxybenzoate polyprenyltransferase